MKLNWNFQRGGGLGKIPSVEGVWIFSGTTQCSNTVLLLIYLIFNVSTNGKDRCKVNCCLYQLIFFSLYHLEHTLNH